MSSHPIAVAPVDGCHCSWCQATRPKPSQKPERDDRLMPHRAAIFEDRDDGTVVYLPGADEVDKITYSDERPRVTTETSQPTDPHHQPTHTTNRPPVLPYGGQR